MTKPVKPVPEGYHNLTPYLVIEGAAAAIDFYVRAFGARERMRIPAPDGRVGHAEIQIGDSCLMLADQCPEYGAHGPGKYGGSPVSLMLYVEDVDATVARAVEAGATLVRPVQDQFYGDRSGMLRDPFGHSWHVSTHIEDVPEAELQRRMQAMRQGQGG